jgi:hypothetical protein
MMLKVDFGAVVDVGRNPKGLMVTLFLNWLVKPFGMAFLGWLFFKHLFLPWIGPELADQYTAGVIILAAAPCTAMVFVWSYLTDGDPAYTLVQVAMNDLLMLGLFAPIVKFLVSGTSGLEVPFDVLLWSVIVLIVIPLTAGVLTWHGLLKAKGHAWFEQVFLPRLHPIAISALLLTLVRLIDLGRAKSEARGLGNIEFRVADMLALGYPDESFDAVVYVFGIFFVPDMAGAVRELWRLVRPGGRLASPPGGRACSSRRAASSGRPSVRSARTCSGALTPGTASITRRDCAPYWPRRGSGPPTLPRNPDPIPSSRRRTGGGLPWAAAIGARWPNWKPRHSSTSATPT